MINKIIRNFIAKQMAGRSDDGIMITLKDPQRVTLGENILADTLMRYGIDPTAIKSEAQLKNILQQIKNAQAAEIRNTGIRQTESAKIFNRMGEELDPNKPIIGGTQPGKSIDTDTFVRLAETNTQRMKQRIADKKIDDDFDLEKGLNDLDEFNVTKDAARAKQLIDEQPPPGNRGGPDDIAAPVQSSEETLKNMIMAENKKNIAKMRQRKMLEEAIDDASPGFSGDRKVDAELVAENLAERMGLVYDDMPTKERLKLYDEAFTGLSKKKPGPEEKADGGRIGLKGGADASQFDKSPSEQRSVDISPSGGVTLGSEPPEGPDDRGSDDQNMVQMLVNAGYTPKEIREITNPTAIDKIKQSRFNNPLTRGILRTGAYLYNPTFAGIDFRKALQAKDLYDYAMNQINNPTITEEDMQFAKGGRAGFFMGSPFPKGLATLREMLKFFGKGKEKERTGSEILRLVNPKQFNKLLEDPNIYKKFDIQKGIGAPDLIKNMQADLTKNRKMMVEEILSAAKNIRQSDIGTMERKKEIVAEMMRKGVDRETAEEMADTLSKMAEAAAGKKLDTPKLTDEGILELENILKNMETGGKKKRDLNADGGRIGFKDGMTRRTFLKLLGGLAAIPIVGKVFKPLKTVKGVKNVPIIKTDNVPGKPEWFDQLVNKVIIEGDDVTKRFATKEREIVHSKQIDEDNYVTVTQDLDEGVVRVEYENPKATMFGEKVDLTYKKPLPDEGDPRPVGEFQTTESGIVGRAQGPDDYDLEIEGMSGRAIEDLESDVSKLKEYATGKKPTLKEIVQNKKRKDKVKYYETPEGQSEYVVQRQGEYDYSPDDAMASGGIARMLGE